MAYEFRYGMRCAVTWRIVAELMRRHHNSCGIRVYEMHPGDGQYDCLTLAVSKPQDELRALCYFNIQSQHLHVFHPYDRPRTRLEDLGWPNGNDYVLSFLTANDPRDVVDSVEALLGLPEGSLPQPTSPPTLIVRVIAGLMERQVLSRSRLEARCCWHDSSGVQGCFAEDWIAWFPAVRDKVEQMQLENRVNEIVHWAGRLWRISHEDSGGAVMVDLGTGDMCVPGYTPERVNLWPVYLESHRSVHKVTDLVGGHLGF